MSFKANGPADGPADGPVGRTPTDAVTVGQKTTAVTGRRVSPLSRLLVGLAFIGPNIVGFLSFTLLPLLIAIVMTFTDWDLRLHNPQKAAEAIAEGREAVSPAFVGLSNFRELLFEPTLPGERGMLFGLFGDITWDPGFWKFLGNTLFFMMAMPFGIALSLLGAVLLSKDLTGGTPTNRRRTIYFGGVTAGVLLLVGGLLTFMTAGGEMNGMVLLFAAVASLIVLGGVIGGQAIYRTIFYLPHFVSGVATFILWKKIFNKETGPLTTALAPVLDGLETIATAVPAGLIWLVGWLLLGGAAALSLWCFRRLATEHRDGELGLRAMIAPTLLLLVPVLMICRWFGLFDLSPSPDAVVASLGPVSLPVMKLAALAMLVVGGVGVVILLRQVLLGQELTCRKEEGAGNALMFGAVFMVFQLILIGLAAAVFFLPSWAASPGGLETPDWLGGIHWAKPSIMFMGLWAAIGGNTMLLYLAALTNVPQELYEAADIDGAGRFTKFWNVTWPQLAPTTFFVVVMGVIGGLQGGFEMAKVMTNGGPARQTTTLSFFIYQSGFETGRLAFASAVSWVLFILVFTVTLFNWRFGNAYVND